MNCANHQELQAVAFCRDCGKPMCAECRIPALGSIYCAEHAPVTATIPEFPRLPPPPEDYKPRDYRTFAEMPPSPPPPPPPAAEPFTSPYTSAEPVRQGDLNAHPAVAFLLGFIPGVGAIYNGQYAKGLIHAVVFGMLVTAISGAERINAVMAPLLGILISAWVFYMAFEAFHTAARRRRGVAVDEFSSLMDVRPRQGRFPVGALILIGLGFVLLLDTTDIINIDQLSRYWPVGLIVLGVYMLYNRVSGERAAASDAEAEARR